MYDLTILGLYSAIAMTILCILAIVLKTIAISSGNDLHNPYNLIIIVILLVSSTIICLYFYNRKSEIEKNYKKEITTQVVDRKSETQGGSILFPETDYIIRFKNKQEIRTSNDEFALVQKGDEITFYKDINNEYHLTKK